MKKFLPENLFENIEPHIYCDITGRCERFGAFSDEKALRLDLTNIEGMTGYCSNEAASLIREKFKNYDASGIHYLDNGNFHYLTYFRLEQIKEDFELVLFDHHNDMQSSALIPLLSCGNWVRSALKELSNLKAVHLIGPESLPEEFLDFEEAKKVRFYGKEIGKTASLEINHPIYLSVDLDILSKEEIETVWDQGDMTVNELKIAIEIISFDREVIGIDICG